MGHSRTMIVSASYRTDIPAFYSDWFINRLRAGYALVANPYSGRPYRVSLAREDVDGFVFWTRNTRPLLPHLQEIQQVAPFVLQMTVTGYPRAVEASVIAADQAISDMQQIAGRVGPHAVVWRYDPILISSLTPVDWHLENFSRLAGALSGVTDEVVVSFTHVYAKTQRNLDAAARAGQGFRWRDPDTQEKREVLQQLAGISSQHAMRLTVCSQPDLLSPGVTGAACIDAARLAALGATPFKSRQKGNRPGCLCAESRDIGAYDSCPHGCAYCYATRNQAAAKTRYKAHDPPAEML